MTTRWKTRTAPAAKPATPEAFESLPYDGTTADIRKMIARVHFLEAEGRYHAVIAGPDRDRHWKEIDAIIQRLAVDVLGSFDDAIRHFAAEVSSAPRRQKPAGCHVQKFRRRLHESARKTPRGSYAGPFRGTAICGGRGRHMIATLRIHYRSLKLRALMFVLRRLMARAERRSDESAAQKAPDLAISNQTKGRAPLQRAP